MGNIFGNGTALFNDGPDVKSDSSIRVETIAGKGEKWGDYKKTYSSGMFGTTFNQPNSVTNPTTGEKVNVLCQCRYINEFMYGNGPDGKKIANSVWVAILNGSVQPACWDDATTISNPGGGSTYWVGYKFPGFYAYAANRNGTIGIASDYAKSIKNGTAATATIMGVKIPVPSLATIAAMRAGSRRIRKSRGLRTRRV